MKKSENIQVHPASLYIEKFKNSNKRGASEVLRKIKEYVEDYKIGSEVLQFSIVTGKKFLVNNTKRFDFEEIIPHGQTVNEVFMKQVQALEFSFHKEKFKEEGEKFVAAIISPDFLSKLDENGHLLFEDMIEIQVSKQKKYLEFSNFRTKVLLDLTK